MTLQAADQGDTTTVQATLAEARANVEFMSEDGMQDVVADKGYHSGATLAAIGGSNVQTYIPEPERGRRNWSGCEAERDLVYANRRRVRSQRGRRLLKVRSELVEPQGHTNDPQVHSADSAIQCLTNSLSQSQTRGPNQSIIHRIIGWQRAGKSVASAAATQER